MGILTFPPNLSCTGCTRVVYTCRAHVSCTRVKPFLLFVDIIERIKNISALIISSQILQEKKRWQLSHNRRRFVPKTRKFLPSPVPDRPHFLVSSLIFRFFKAFFVGCCSARMIVGPFIFLEDFLYY